MFTDRVDAGQRLATELDHLRGPGTVVLGIPRGGVVVAREVADRLGAPLDVVVVRKLGAPQNPEFAVGAIGEDGARVIDAAVVAQLGLSPDTMAEIESRERGELGRRVARFRAGHPRLDLTGATAVLVDDGVATGSTAAAACRVARSLGAGRLVLAVPVAPRGWTASMADAADEYVAVAEPRDFFAVGQFYADFAQVSDRQVVAALGG